MSTAELATAAGFDRTVTHRLLRTLQAAGMVQGAGSNYALAGGALLLANAYLDRLEVRNAALPFVVNLSTTACAGNPWVVYLSIPVADTAVTIDRIWNANAPLDTLLGLGTSFPLVESAAGRSMLAFWSRERRAAVIGPVDADLVAHLDWIRSNGGIEFNRGEHQRGICGIAAAVVTNHGEPVASIIVSGPQLEAHLEVTSPLAVQVHRTAQSIGRSLGSPSRPIQQTRGSAS